MVLPFNFAPLSVTWNYKTNHKTDNNMPEQINTVTISLSEYNDMRQSLDTLHNALEDNKVIIRDIPYSHWRSYMACQTFTHDAALTMVAEKYYELENKYKALQQDNESLTSKLYWMEKTWWFKLGKLFDKRNLIRK